MLALTPFLVREEGVMLEALAIALATIWIGFLVAIPLANTHDNKLH